MDKPISADVMTSVEDKCNLNIRKSVPVSVTLFERGDPQLEEVCIEFLRFSGSVSFLYQNTCGCAH